MNAKLIESLVQIIQSISKEERLLLEKKLAAHETQTNFDNLSQALAELRQICAEENYTIEVPTRQDRSHTFAKSLNDLPV
ncbi:MAG: hypothetical protein EHM73_06420 [Chroococcales cyanobacterium metabat2.561]|jgi:hypothetical protein|uniref:Uncharacterized protein n=1 Tax=Microcystis aeruginosa Ma_SC_T_19800800_S464 TaxID=2486257 RepID=A0A552E0Q0_MICAE|nr:MAG: hypothetical protein EHM73_06420 [Chroococcales cyanobacterium metabat2.561]TRU28066.1 MAG: hypothetical protein EWV81_05825 [Microcystis aeruginosa Ma_SC_T_19800800_S464]